MFLASSAIVLRMGLGRADRKAVHFAVLTSVLRFAAVPEGNFRIFEYGLRINKKAKVLLFIDFLSSFFLLVMVFNHDDTASADQLRDDAGAAQVTVSL